MKERLPGFCSAGNVLNTDFQPLIEGLKTDNSNTIPSIHYTELAYLSSSAWFM